MGLPQSIRGINARQCEKDIRYLLPPWARILDLWVLRSPSSSGGKDWACCETDLGVFTLWGKMDQIRQIGGPKPLRHGLIADLLNSKQNKGYRVVAGFSDISQHLIARDDGIDISPRAVPHSTPARPRSGPSQLDQAITAWIGAEQAGASAWF